MIKIGITGVGQFGQNHARILRQSDNCEFVGLYDRDMKRAHEIAEKIDAKVFESYDQLLEQVDAMAIVVTTLSHYDLAKRALENGVHVLSSAGTQSESHSETEGYAIRRTNNLSPGFNQSVQKLRTSPSSELLDKLINSSRLEDGETINDGCQLRCIWSTCSR